MQDEYNPYEAPVVVQTNDSTALRTAEQIELTHRGRFWLFSSKSWMKIVGFSVLLFTLLQAVQLLDSANTFANFSMDSIPWAVYALGSVFVLIFVVLAVSIFRFRNSLIAYEGSKDPESFDKLAVSHTAFWRTSALCLISFLLVIIATITLFYFMGREAAERYSTELDQLDDEELFYMEE